MVNKMRAIRLLFLSPVSLLFCVAFGLLAVPLVAVAQEEQLVLEEVIVTAQKREQTLQDVPISITALSGEKINTFAAGGEDIRLLSSRIPGLNAESSNGRVAPRFYIRGLGNTDFDLAASQPVSVVVDEIVQENVILKSFPLFDIDRVEVLRGPQGTLFGRNTPAGIIKFETRKPSQEREGHFNASYGSFSTSTVEFAMGGGISDTVSSRLSLLYQSRDDYVNNAYLGVDDAMGGFDEFAGRLQFLLEPSDTFSALFNFHFRTYDGTASLFRANILTTGSDDINSNFDRDNVFFGDDHHNPQEYDSWGSSLRLDWDFDNEMRLTSITAYETTDGSSLGDIDGGNPDGPGFIPFQSTTEDGLDDLEQITQEFRLSQQASDQMFWQLGLFYFDSDLTIRTRPFFVPDSIIRHQNDAWALFGQVSYDMSDANTLTVGLRYTDDEKTADAFSGAFGAQLPTVELSDDHLSWDIALNHVRSDDLSFYGRIASGFRAPTIQSRDVAFFGIPTTAPSETILSYEAGFKADAADGRLRWNGAIFYYDVSDQQVTAVGGATNSVQLVSIDEVTAWGIETDIEWIATDNLIITAGIGYTDTEISDPNLRVPTCGSGQCTPLDPLDIDGFAIVDGNTLPNAPDWTMNFTADYHLPVGEGEFFVFADYAYQGDTRILLYDAVEFNSDGTFELGLRTGYRFGDSLQYEVSAFGRNITDEENLKGVIDFNNNTGFVNEPRIWGLAFSTQW
jgi:iron complex outermembrane receptor protein